MLPSFYWKALQGTGVTGELASLDTRTFFCFFLSHLRPQLDPRITRPTGTVVLISATGGIGGGGYRGRYTFPLSRTKNEVKGGQDNLIKAGDQAEEFPNSRYASVFNENVM